jgi:hypothetical protein
VTEFEWDSRHTEIAIAAPEGMAPRGTQVTLQECCLNGRDRWEEIPKRIGHGAAIGFAQPPEL